MVLGILAALLGAVLPLVFQTLERERAEATREQLRTIKEAILGDGASPARGAGGEEGGRDRSGTFGFNGDLGALPDSLHQLAVQDNLAAFQMDPDWRLGAGWRGPYLTTGGGSDLGAALRDAFGRSLTYSSSTLTVSGEVWAGYVQSGGADGVTEPVTATGTDDVVVPLLRDETRGRSTGYLRHGSGQPISQAAITYAYRLQGQVATVTTTTDDVGRYQGPIHAFGPAVVRTGTASGTRLGFVRNLTRVLGPDNEDLEFRLVDATRSDVTVTSLTATWSGGPTCYSDVRFAGVDVDGGGVNCHTSGSTVTFVPTVRLPAGGGFANSVSERRFELDRPTVVAPELVVAGASTRGSRGEALVELLDWQDGAGNPVSVAGGLQITVTLTESSGASLTSTFTTPD